MRKGTQKTLELYKNLCSFDEGIKFNTIGLMNTNDKKHFYRITAVIGQ